MKRDGMSDQHSMQTMRRRSKGKGLKRLLSHLQCRMPTFEVVQVAAQQRGVSRPPWRQEDSTALAVVLFFLVCRDSGIAHALKTP